MNLVSQMCIPELMVYIERSLSLPLLVHVFNLDLFHFSGSCSLLLCVFHLSLISFTQHSCSLFFLFSCFLISSFSYIFSILSFSLLTRNIKENTYHWIIFLYKNKYSKKSSWRPCMLGVLMFFLFPCSTSKFQIVGGTWAWRKRYWRWYCELWNGWWRWHLHAFLDGNHYWSS